jgi:hypothetical protein
MQARLLQHAAPAAAAPAPPARGAPRLRAPPPRAAAPAAPGAAPAAGAQPAPRPPPSFSGRPGLHDSEGRVLLKNLTYEELEEWCEALGALLSWGSCLKGGGAGSGCGAGGAVRRVGAGAVGSARAPAGAVNKRTPSRAWAPPPAPRGLAGEDPKRAGQVWRAMYADKRWMRSWEDAAAGPAPFSRAFVAKAAAAGSVHGQLTLQRAHTAPDGTHKWAARGARGGAGGPAAACRPAAARRRQYRVGPVVPHVSHPPPPGPARLVFALHGSDGAASGSVETVLIPMFNRAGTQPRYTACLSTQVGGGASGHWGAAGRRRGARQGPGGGARPQHVRVWLAR